LEFHSNSARICAYRSGYLASDASHVDHDSTFWCDALYHDCPLNYLD
jgi:hypothetical protein